VSAAKHTPGSIAALAEEARTMPWDKSITDVPHSARYAFQQAITADHYLELLDALQDLVEAGEEAWGSERPCVSWAIALLKKHGVTQ
jgi:hypothetical protein